VKPVGLDRAGVQRDNRCVPVAAASSIAETVCTILVKGGRLGAAIAESSRRIPVGSPIDPTRAEGTAKHARLVAAARSRRNGAHSAGPNGVQRRTDPSSRRADDLNRLFSGWQRPFILKRAGGDQHHVGNGRPQR